MWDLVNEHISMTRCQCHRCQRSLNALLLNTPQSKSHSLYRYISFIPKATFCSEVVFSIPQSRQLLFCYAVDLAVGAPFYGPGAVFIYSGQEKAQKLSFELSQVSGNKYSDKKYVKLNN